MHTLEREQRIARPLPEVFAFFAEPANLEAITPPWLRFRILPPTPAPLHVGAEIHYALRWRGLPLRWLTVIEGWGPPFGFVDVQRRGPYRLWHHTHRFEPDDGGTIVRDLVRYALPFGPIGALSHVLLVRSDVRAIFDYRTRKVAELLDGGDRHPRDA